MGRVASLATRMEELIGRTEATFLGGCLLPVMTYSVLHQAREEASEAVSHLEEGDPSDVVEQCDFFASAMSELGALLKILSTMELDGDAALKEDWEKLADDLQSLAAVLQRAAEKFEDAIDASEGPEGLVNIQLR